MIEGVSESTTRRRLRAFAAVLIALVGWELACRLALVSPVLLRPPSRVVRTIATLLGERRIEADLLFTVSIYFGGLALSLVSGLAVGLLIGFSRRVEDVLMPFIVGAAALPKIVLMPLIVLWLGIGPAANLFLATLMGAFPIVLALHAGVRALDPELLRLARAFGAPRAMTLRELVLPSLLPFLLAGLRVAVSTTMVGAIIAEFFASSRGLGYRVRLAMDNFEIDEFYAGVTLIAALTLSVQALVAALERRVEAGRPALPGSTGGVIGATG